MEDMLGVRLYAAVYVTAGILVAWIGSVLGTVGTANSSLDATLVGFATWIAFVFAGIVIALKGIVVLVGSTIEETVPNAG
ncbi:putative membrane protein [Halorhabdus sp. SVX81]|uniref:hypothetical protein n=1 Tax=Halorhabdus sp. SVX81 TaxID=2978283 RepID=UPI0023DAF1F3|nr:hypothetical protein [Halorhabdus sp. SVX81]WEL17507.1 putative membrane protein [Halorhabdus sp. SVX81]